KQQKEEDATEGIRRKSEKKGSSRVSGTNENIQKNKSPQNLTATIHEELESVHHEIARGSGNGKDTDEVERISPEKVIPLEDFKDF
ncbi:MAG: hypothetical protein WHT84_01375, partial [Breznakiellaceae bacterium]